MGALKESTETVSYRDASNSAEVRQMLRKEVSSLHKVSMNKSLDSQVVASPRT